MIIFCIILNHFSDKTQISRCYPERTSQRTYCTSCKSFLIILYQTFEVFLNLKFLSKECYKHIFISFFFRKETRGRKRNKAMCRQRAVGESLFAET